MFNPQAGEWQPIEVRVDTGALGANANSITQGTVIDRGLEKNLENDKEVINQRVGAFVSPSKVTTNCKGLGDQEFILSFRVVPRGATDSRPHLGLEAFQTYENLLLWENPQKSIAYTAWGKETVRLPHHLN